MRGLCSNSNIDKYWTAQVKLGRFYLLGILSSQIDYDFLNKKWNMKVEKLIEGVFLSFFYPEFLFYLSI